MVTYEERRTVSKNPPLARKKDKEKKSAPKRSIVWTKGGCGILANQTRASIERAGLVKLVKIA